MRSLPKWFTGLFVVVLAVGATVVPMPAGAATVSQTYTVSGSLIVGPPPALVLPAGSTITFDLDPVTGAVTNGQTSIPAFPRGGTGAQADIVITDAAPFTGTIDPVTGESSVSFVFNVGIIIAEGIECALGGPVSFTASSSNAGGAPLAGGTAIVTAPVVSIPAIVEGPTCNADVAGLANELLSLPDANASASFTVTEVVPPTPPAPPAPPAPVKPAVPAFTG